MTLLSRFVFRFGGRLAAAAVLVLAATPLACQCGVRTQAVGLDLDAVGNLVRLTSSNALALSIGAF